MSEVESGPSVRPFETLSDSRQALIDELAREDVDDLDRTNAEIVSDAVERHGIDECSPVNVSQVRGRYADYIEERKPVILNDHQTVNRGQVTIAGDIDFTDEDTFPKPQTWDERPVKHINPESEQEPESGESGVTDDDHETVTIDVDRETLWKIIGGELTPSDRKRIFEQVMGR